MKNNVIVSILAITLIAMISCKPSKEKSIEKISALEKELLSTNISIDTSKAEELIALYKEYVNKFKNDSLAPEYLFKYSDVKNAYFGERNIDITQLMLPVTYNFNFFKNGKSYGSFQIKVGLNLQYNYLAITNYGILPEYDYKKISGGLTIGFRLLPFNFKNDKILGFYLDAYRGSQIYEDFYNRSNFEMPGSSFSKFGVFFQF